LHAAAWFGHELASRVLVESSADIESRSSDGETPLFAAARNGHGAVVRLLATNGADIKAQARGWTPLRVARSNGYTAVANALTRFYNSVFSMIRLGIRVILEYYSGLARDTARDAKLLAIRNIRVF
jgi:ankyrin repeat protein